MDWAIPVTAPRWVSVFALCMLSAATLGRARGKDLYLEAETSPGSHVIRPRSNASSQKAVLLTGGGQALDFDFCLKQKTQVQTCGDVRVGRPHLRHCDIQWWKGRSGAPGPGAHTSPKISTLVYSNDGDSERLRATVDQQEAGTFSTHFAAGWGFLWNVFRKARDRSAPTLLLARGRHLLTVTVLAPSSGVELDQIVFSVDDEGLSNSVLQCRLLCLPSTPSIISPALPFRRPLATMMQASYPTLCAEEDNVKLALYSSGLQEYVVTATLPLYGLTLNQRHNDDSNCPHLPPVEWSFADLPSPCPGQTFTHTSTFATLTASCSKSSALYQVQMYRVNFTLRGRSKGYVDAEMGSTLTLSFLTIKTDMFLMFSYIGRSGVLTSAVAQTAVTATETTYTVSFVDFTWREVNDVVFVSLQTKDPVPLTRLEMQRRPMRGEKVTKVYDSWGMLVEVVEVDFWWRRPEMMTLRNGETGQTWKPVDYFRIYVRMPGSNSYVQVLVMYQDGNVRLAPLPPAFLDWVPFGTSVILGRSRPSDLRPCAPVTSVTFHPATLLLDVVYQDGTSARLTLLSGETSTRLWVNVLNETVADEEPLPFATVRSMYVEDGNCDADSLQVDGGVESSIMDQPATPVSGRSFLFYRRCQSSHLSLSPDIAVHLLRGSSVA